LKTCKAFSIVLCFLALSACDALKTLGATAAPIAFGTYEEPVPDQRLIARDAAAHALIQKGLETADPVESRRLIDQGVGMLQ